MAFKNGSLISPEGRKNKGRGREKWGGGGSGKAQERQEIVHFARGTFNYLIAELMLCPQVTLDVHFAAGGSGWEKVGREGAGAKANSWSFN